MKKNKSQNYSTLEKKAYYTGMGVGLVGDGALRDGLARKAFDLMSEKEKISYLRGYERGLDNSVVVAGCRNPKKWF